MDRRSGVVRLSRRCWMYIAKQLLLCMSIFCRMSNAPSSKIISSENA